MHTETLSTGSELTAGSGIDTNVAWLARELAKLGLGIARHTILPDCLASVRDHILALRRGPRPAILIITGGLGPTLDDVTREAVAEAMDAPLCESAACRATLEETFRRRNWNFAQNNLRQALVPTGATVLLNPRGTAPGFYIARDNLHLFSMPGVPSEMMGMFTEQVLPILRTILPPGRTILERTLHTFGLGESTVGQKIADHMTRGRNPEVGTTVANGLVSVRIFATAPTAAEAAVMLQREEQEIVAKLGEIVIGRDEERLPEVVAKLMKEKHATLAVAESCTGGLIAKMITDVSGASEFFMEGLVTYANEAKTSRLAVPPELIKEHGAVSEPVARAMADGLRHSTGVTYALSTTGIAGPTGGTPQKPVGLVFVALASPTGTEAIQQIFPGDRDRIRHRAALAALNLLRLRLQK